MGERRRRAERGRYRRHNAAGEPRELSGREWAAEMRGWAGKALEGKCRGRRDSGASGVEVVGQGLVDLELEVGDGVGLGGVEGRCLIKEPCEEIALRWSAGGRIRAGEAGAGTGSEDRFGEATSPSAAGGSGTDSGRPRTTTWGLSLAFGASTPW